MIRARKRPTRRVGRNKSAQFRHCQLPENIENFSRNALVPFPVRDFREPGGRRVGRNKSAQFRHGQAPENRWNSCRNFRVESVRYQTNPPTDPDVKVSLIRFFGNPSGGTTQTHNFAVRSRDQMGWMILGRGKGQRSSSFANESQGMALLWLRRLSQ